MPGSGGGGGGTLPMPGNWGGGGGMPESGGAGGVFVMGDVGFMAAVPEGRGGGAGGAGLAAVLEGGLDFSGRAQQTVNWQDEIFSLASGPEAVAGALVGFDDPTGRRVACAHGSGSPWTPPAALPDRRFSARFCLLGCFLMDSSLSMTSSTVFPWTRETSQGQEREWGPQAGSCYSTKQQIWSHGEPISWCHFTQLHLASRQFPCHVPTPQTLLSMPASKTGQHQQQDTREPRYPLIPTSQSSGINHLNKTGNPKPTAKCGHPHGWSFT